MSIKLVIRKNFSDLANPPHMPVQKSGTTELPIPLGGRSWITVDIQFRHIVRGEPLAIRSDNLCHVSRLSIKRDLARPGAGGTTRFAWLGKGTTLVFHLFLSQTAQDSAGEHNLSAGVR